MCWQAHSDWVYYSLDTSTSWIKTLLAIKKNKRHNIQCIKILSASHHCIHHSLHIKSSSLYDSKQNIHSIKLAQGPSKLAKWHDYHFNGCADKPACRVNNYFFLC